MVEDKSQFGTKNYCVSEEEAIKYVLNRFKEVKESNKIKNLVQFQENNKYMIMAHDQIELKNLGNLVARYKKKPFSEILIEYEKHLGIAMTKVPTIKTHTNVIWHIFGHFSQHLNQYEKQSFFDWLQQFQGNKITLGDILLKIGSIVYRLNNTYLSSQTYFLLFSDPQLQNLFYTLNKKNPSSSSS